MVRRATAWIGLTSILLALACVSPTLPLPPPALPEVGISSMAGKVRLSSVRGAEPNAIIVVYNRDPNLPLDQRISGAQADLTGSWDADVQASPGDFLDVSQESGTTRSAPTTVQIPTTK